MEDKIILQIENDDVVMIWPNLESLEGTGFSTKMIERCLGGRLKEYNGFKWEWCRPSDYIDDLGGFGERGYNAPV